MRVPILPVLALFLLLAACRQEPVPVASPGPAAVDAGGLDLLILDGEATPSGGMGLAKQLKDEVAQCPPILVLIIRVADAWLATWSRADAAVMYPVDPVRLPAAVAELLRARLAQAV